MKTCWAILFFISLYLCSNAQSTSKKVVQLSGVVVSSDSLYPVSYAAIFNKNDKRGSFSKEDGFFSIVAKEGDTIQFSSIGYHYSFYIIPVNNEKDKLTIVQLLSQNEYFLDTVIVIPRMSKEEFKNRFINDEYTNDQIAIAQQNLNRQRMAEISDHMAMDGKENSNAFMANEQKRFYFGRQIPTNMMQVNPLAWYKFIQAWRNGDFKRKRTPDDRLD